MPRRLEENRLSRALAHLRRERQPFIDLTVSNPTCAGFDYPPDLLGGLADPRGLVYRPEQLGLTAAREGVATDVAQRGLQV
jgi:hypothetical protein